MLLSTVSVTCTCRTLGFVSHQYSIIIMGVSPGEDYFFHTQLCLAVCISLSICGPMRLSPPPTLA